MFKIYAKSTASFADVTDYISRDSLNKSEQLQEKANSCAFEMESNPLTEGQEIKIYDTTELTDTSSATLITVKNLYDKVKKFRKGEELWLGIGTANEEMVEITSVDTKSSRIAVTTASNTHSIGSLIGIKKFAGHVSQVSDRNQHQLKNLAYTVNAFDYTKEFDRKAINDSWTNYTAKQIIDEFVKEKINVGLTEKFTTSQVMTGSVFTRVRSAFRNPVELMQRLSEADNFSWWIDYNKVINYKPFLEENAPYKLTDNSNNFIDLSIKTDLTMVKNRQVVLGGFEDAINDTVEFHRGDGAKREWVLRSKFSGLSIAVGTNSSSMTTASVLPDFINEEGTADYFSNFQGQSVRAADTTSTLETTSLIRFSYKEKIPINVLDEDPTSIARLKALGFGDGVMEGRPIVDSSIDSRTEAQNRARAELLKYSNPILNATFKTELQGLKAGQAIRITDTARKIDEDFLIQRVRERVYAGENSVFDVTCASTLYGINELIRQLLRGDSKISLDEDIGIDLLKLITENVSMTSSWQRQGEGDTIETISMTSSWTKKNIVPPFVWVDNNENSLKLVSAQSQRLEITDADQTGLDITGDISIEGWVNLESLPSGAPGSGSTICAKWLTSGSQRAYYFRINDNFGLTFSYSQDGGSTNLTTCLSDSAVVSAGDIGNWIHFAVSVAVASQTVILYKNSVPVASTNITALASSIKDSTARFRIGIHDSSTVRFDGLMDEIRVWNKALSQAEIENIYNRRISSTTSGLVSYWKFDGSFNDSVAASQNHLTPINGASLVNDVPTIITETTSNDGIWNLSSWG